MGVYYIEFKPKLPFETFCVKITDGVKEIKALKKKNLALILILVASIIIRYYFILFYLT